MSAGETAGNLAELSSVAARVSDLSRLYGDFAALRNVSWTFARGRATVLLGENGAGKSTLLRVIAGLVQPSRGTAALPLAARTSYMSHDSMLYDEMTAAENLAYFAAMYPTGVCLDARESLRRVGLVAELARPVGKYSQGMRQRVSLARALMPQPELLLLDEPFANLDRGGAASVLGLLAGMRDSGTTIIFTTHQPELAARLADVTLRMSRGTLAEESQA